MWKFRQCGHVIDAYCTIVTGASGRPQLISGNGLGAMMSATVGFWMTCRPLEAVTLGSPNGVGIPLSKVSEAVDGYAPRPLLSAELSEEMLAVAGDSDGNVEPHPASQPVKRKAAAKRRVRARNIRFSGYFPASSGPITLSNASIDGASCSFLPLIKKVGVALTPKVSLARVRSAVI